jgi:hypothetical protein
VAALGLQKSDFGDAVLAVTYFPCFITTCGLGTNDGYAIAAVDTTAKTAIFKQVERTESRCFWHVDGPYAETRAGNAPQLVLAEMLYVLGKMSRQGPRS